MEALNRIGMVAGLPPAFLSWAAAGGLFLLVFKEEPELISFELPFPPSTNRIWRKWRGRIVLSNEGRAFREQVCALLATSGQGDEPPNDGRIALAMDAFPPDRRRRDLDNLQKSTLDAIEHAGVYENDSQIDLLIARRREVIKGGLIQIQIDDYPPTRCPVCGGPIHPENN